MEVRDSNGTLLNEGDSVTLIKDLKVMDTSLPLTLRRYAYKKNRLVDNEEEVDCRVNGTDIVLRTEFLKKSLRVLHRFQFRY